MAYTRYSICAFARKNGFCAYLRSEKRHLEHPFQYFERWRPPPSQRRGARKNLLLLPLDGPARQRSEHVEKQYAAKAAKRGTKTRSSNVFDAKQLLWTPWGVSSFTEGVTSRSYTPTSGLSAEWHRLIVPRRLTLSAQ